MTTLEENAGPVNDPTTDYNIFDPEFVRDQARERMGVAEPGEIVIRVDGARNMATPAKPAAQPAPAPAGR